MIRRLLGLAFLFSTSSYAAPVVIKVTNITNTHGAIYISLFAHSQSWDQEKPDQVIRMFPLKMGTTSMTVDLPVGDYAFFLFNDIDNDGKLKQNPLGMPMEPYAFSNNFKLQFSKPTWAQLKFNVIGAGARQTIRLVNP